MSTEKEGISAEAARLLEQYSDACYDVGFEHGAAKTSLESGAVEAERDVRYADIHEHIASLESQLRESQRDTDRLNELEDLREHGTLSVSGIVCGIVEGVFLRRFTNLREAADAEIKRRAQSISEPESPNA